MTPLQIADQLERELLEVANGDRKPGKLSIEPISRAAALLRKQADAATIMDAIEGYDFECEGGPLVGSARWQQLRKLIGGAS